MSTAAAAATKTKTKTHRVGAGLLLARPPIILPEPTRFESLYFVHEQNKAEDAAAPFPADFYFKKGSIAEKTWVEKVTKGRPTPEEAIVQPTEVGGVALEPRVNPKEDANPQSLARLLDRTLYLIVKGASKTATWTLPQRMVEGKEALHNTAMRALHEGCGEAMNVWVVAPGPVGHMVEEGAEASSVYFIKGNILAGQAKPDGKSVQDFAWVTREEMSKYVGEAYYKGVAPMLSEQ